MSRPQAKAQRRSSNERAAADIRSDLRPEPCEYLFFDFGWALALLWADADYQSGSVAVLLIRRLSHLLRQHVDR